MKMEIFISIILLINVLITAFILYKYVKMPNFNHTFSDMYKEFKDFSLKIIVRSILERLLISQNDANGSSLALKDISSISEPFYHGVIVSVVGNMSEDLKKRFFYFFKRTKDDSALIIEISSLIEIYSVDIVQRLKIFETEANNANKIAITNNKKPIEVRDYIYGLLINSIINDVKFLNDLKTVNNNK